MPNYTATVTLLAIALYFYFSTRVGAARGRFGVKHPATTGHPDFERVFRAHINALEWMPIFLAPLWLSDPGAAALGVVWIGGRIAYFRGYSIATEKREAGFLVQAVACIVLFIGAAVGIARHWTGF